MLLKDVKRAQTPVLCLDGELQHKAYIQEIAGMIEH